MRAFDAVTGEPWAIQPHWLPVIAALAQRNREAPEVAAVQARERVEFDLIAGPGAQRLPGAERAVIADGVAVIPVLGPIFPRANMMTQMSGATSVTMLQNDYRAALANEDVGAIMLLLDSPGGAVSGINAFADQVFAGRKSKRTMAFVAGSAASAAYWIASAASDISVERTAILGSIGVVAAVPKQVQPGGDGYVDVEIVSSGAPLKRPDPTTEDGAAAIRAMLDSIEGQFVADVARGRGVSTATVLSDFGQGGVLVGSAAVDKKMADRVSSYEKSFGDLARMVRAERRVKQLKQA